MDQSTVLNSGARSLQKLVSAEYIDAVLYRHNRAVMEIWYLSLALAYVPVIGVSRMEWRLIQSTQSKETRSDVSDEANLQDAEQKEPESKKSGLIQNKPASVDAERAQA